MEIITSDSQRVGKSTYITTKIKSQGYLKYIIPLGEIDEELIKLYTRALEINKNEKIAIVLELYENADELTYNLIRNFLFEILILKCYNSFNYISQDLYIFIEVSSDYINFEEDFRFLTLFKKKHIQLRGNKNFYIENPILFNSDNMINNLSVLMHLKFLNEGKIEKINIDQNLLNNIKKIDFKTILGDYNSLIQKYFLDKFPSVDILPNYGQIEIFMALLGDLINNLEECEYMNPLMLMKNINRYKKLSNIRETIMNSYIDLVIRFSSFSWEQIIENQEIAIKSQKDIGFCLPKEIKDKLIQKLNNKRIVNYDKFKPSIILFNKKTKDDEYINQCSIITSYKENDEEFEQLNELLVRYLKENAFLLNIDEMARSNFIFELISICQTPYSRNINEKLKNYEFKIDNFIKMILIYLRIRAKIPIILMGETGCGKTSLIEALSVFLEGKYKLLKLNIHSGFTHNNILTYLVSHNLFDENAYPKILNKKEKKSEEKIILFLDEINTINSLNLVSDLFTKNSFLSIPLKNNVYVMGVCNPYRLLLSKNEDIRYINIKRYKITNLAYQVNPLPLSLINYVFDFGYLRKSDEELYVWSFITSFLSDKFSKDNNFNYSYILRKICESVNFSHTYIRTNNEVSSVSLREIKRFRVFFEFFLNIIIERKEIENDYKRNIDKIKYFPNDISEKQKKENIIILKAANLGLFMCYYLKLNDPEKRVELSNKLSEIFQFNFLEYPLQLENELSNNIIFHKGIAKNRALLDNLFAIFVCLNNKIPIFICGKTGFSKSLSFSLLYQSMNGEYSKSELFKKYPELYLTSYKGSLASTSADIKNIFNRANKISKISYRSVKKDNEKSKLLSVILFDEMGFAEISPNKPLNAIHSELENEKNEIGFVGISNWALDASKINRGILLSIQEPDLYDLLVTSKTISYGVHEEIQYITPFKKVIDDLTKSYYNYKIHLKNYYPLYYDFHGARDFYCLIKMTANLLKNNEYKPLESIAMDSIERNFGGLEFDKEDNVKWSSTKKFKHIFSKINGNIENIEKYDIYKCIKNNLEEENRYLLLITDKTKNDTLIELILRKLKFQYKFIQGSKLKEDQNAQYICRKAWSIILSMEKGEVIILKDMEMVYPKFYDLFNQNFSNIGKFSYTTITLDSTNERYIVNKNFRCIILLEKNEVIHQDPSLLNRFEKHLMSFDYLLTEKQNLVAKELYEEIKGLTAFPENINISPLLVNINIEEIRCLIFELSMRVDDLEQNIIQIFKLILPTFTQENILNSVFSFKEKFIKKEELIKIYEENTYTNIYEFFEKVEKNKIIIYTFSPYYKDIFTDNNIIQINNPKFGIISKETTKEIIFTDNLSEKKLHYYFKLYYNDTYCNSFIIHFRVKDTKYLKYIKFLLDEFHQKYAENPNKIFLFIIHIDKNYGIENKNELVKSLENYHSFFFSFLSEYQQITIDNLLEHRKISIINLYNKTNEELLITKELFDINPFIKKEFLSQINQMANNKALNSLLEKLFHLKENDILQCIIKKIQDLIKNSDNLLQKILKDYYYLKDKNFDFISYLIERIQKLISENAKIAINEMIQSGYFESFILEKESQNNSQKNSQINSQNIELINKIQKLENDNLNLLNKVKELENENNRLKSFESEIIELKKILNKYEEENKNLKNNLIKFENQIKILENENKNLEKILSEEKAKQSQKDILNINNSKDRIIDLMEQINIKDKEIKEIKSNIPYKLKKGEKLMTIIFLSKDETIHYSLICKNTDKFSRIEEKLYDIFPEYQEMENHFMVNGKKINKYKTLDENNIKFSDIILINENE